MSRNRISILKETEEDRRERLHYSSTLQTKVVPSKKKKNRAQQKHADIKEMRGEYYET